MNPEFVSKRAYKNGELECGDLGNLPCLMVFEYSVSGGNYRLGMARLFITLAEQEIDVTHLVDEKTVADLFEIYIMDSE